MNEHLLSRRGALFGSTTAGLGVLTATGFGLPNLTRSRSAQAATPDGLDDFTTYMKLYSSLAPGLHWWWFTGHWDLIAPGHAPVPLIGFDTLIRREVTRESDGKMLTRGWEGMVFWDLQSRQLVDRMTNPINGRVIEPFFTKEGPTNTRTSPAGFHIAAAVEPEQTRPLDFPRIVAGDDIWLERTMQARGPHPMAPTEWKLESSGELYWTNLSTVLRGKIGDIRNADMMMAPADYMITGQSVPVPWMMMGQSGAMMGWSGYGRKFASLDDLPAQSRSWYEARHPELFADGEPWSTYSNAFYGYMAERKPVAP